MKRIIFIIIFFICNTFVFAQYTVKMGVILNTNFYSGSNPIKPFKISMNQNNKILIIEENHDIGYI
jgi:hypothetical protein